MMRIVILVCVVALLGCADYSSFTPSSRIDYGERPVDFPIEFYPDTEPDTSFVIVGYAEARGTTIQNALPLLKRQARKHGGSALMMLTTTHVIALAMQYSATVIRYK